jgi:hypothetical protein
VRVLYKRTQAALLNLCDIDASQGGIDQIVQRVCSKPIKERDMQMMVRSSNSTPIEQRIEDLLSQLTQREEVALLTGTDSWHTAAIERLESPRRR